MLNIYRRFQNC